MLNSPTEDGGRTPADRLTDVLKHLTTLSAGTLVLLSSFLTNIIPANPNFVTSLMIAAAFLLLVSSTVIAVRNLVTIVSPNVRGGYFGFVGDEHLEATTRVAGSTYTLGITLFAAAAYINLL